MGKVATIRFCGKCDTIIKACTGTWLVPLALGHSAHTSGQGTIVAKLHPKHRTGLFELHRDLLDRAIASSELANGGERAYPVDRPPPG